MNDPIRELKTRAEILQHSLEAGEAPAVVRLRSLAELRRATTDDLAAFVPKVQRKHCLAIVAREAGSTTGAMPRSSFLVARLRRSAPCFARRGCPHIGTSGRPTTRKLEAFVRSTAGICWPTRITFSSPTGIISKPSASTPKTLIGSELVAIGSSPGSRTREVGCTGSCWWPSRNVRGSRRLLLPRRPPCLMPWHGDRGCVCVRDCDSGLATGARGSQPGLAVQTSQPGTHKAWKPGESL